MLAMAALGFADDWMKLRQAALAGRVGPDEAGRCRRVIAIAPLDVAVTQRVPASIGHVRPARSSDASVDLGYVYPVLIFLVLAGATNGVNLTDGLDGLAAGCARSCFLAFTAMTFITNGQRRTSRCSAPASWAPASASSGSTRSRPSVFMGDTGSLGLGRRDRRAGGDDEDRGAAADDRRHLRDRGAVGG